MHDFRFGPAFAEGSGCCGKPAGCTNPDPGCLFPGSPWKLPAETAIAEPREDED